MNKKKIIGIIIILIALVILSIIIFKPKGETKTTIENETAQNSVILEDIEFKNITKKYEEGITTIRAEIYNNTKKTKNINVKIILKISTLSIRKIPESFLLGMPSSRYTERSSIR